MGLINIWVPIVRRLCRLRGDVVYKPQDSDLIKLNLSPSSTLCIFGQYRIHDRASRDYARLREDQQGLIDEIVFVKDSIIGPKLSLDIDQPPLDFPSLLL